MKSTRRRAGAPLLLVALVLLTLLASLTGTPTATTPAAAGTQGVDRVLVVALPAVGWGDLQRTELPHLEDFLADAAVANLSVRGVHRSTSATDGYTTLGAGTRALGSGLALAAYGPAEEFREAPAGEEFTRRTGLEAPAGSVVNLGIPSLRSRNARLTFGAEVGALGDALEEAGLRRAVIGNSDGWAENDDDDEIQRPQSLALAGGLGIVPAGTVSPDLLRSDPEAPYGRRADPDAVMAEFDARWDESAVVVVDSGDLARWDRYRVVTTRAQRQQMLADSLRHTDALLGRMLERVDPERDAVLLVGPYHRDGDTHLTIAALRAPGVEPGLLRSGSTRRSGVVMLVDVAPTVLDLLAVSRPDAMEGRPFEVGATDGTPASRVARLAEDDLEAAFRDAHVAPASVWYVVGQLLLWLLAALVLRSRRLVTFRIVEVLALAGILFLPATHLATLFDFHAWSDTWWWLFLLATSLGLAVLAQLAGRGSPVDALIVALAAVVLLLGIDVALGAPLQYNAVFGYSPTIGGRFAGFGNLAFAQLAAASIMLAALLAHRLGGRRGLLAAAAVLAVAIVLDGTPFWGSDVGGVLALVPAAALTVGLLANRRIRLRTAAAWALAAVAAVVVFALVDLARPAEQRSHLGRLFESIAGDGWGPFADVVQRKLDANLSVLTSSVWTLMVPVVFAFLGYLFWRAPGSLRQVSERVPAERAALAGLGVAMFLGFAVNDSGIAVPGVMLGVVNASLVYLLLRVNEPGADPPPHPEPPDVPDHRDAVPPTRPRVLAGE